LASKAVEDAIDAYLAANWSNCPIFTENQQSETPDDGSPFLLLQFPVSIVTRSVVDRRYYTEEGGFRIIINVQRGEGTDTIRQWGAELAALFRDQDVGPVECKIPTEPFTGDESDQGNYFQGAMVCRYIYRFDG
jgi:hypothetical protein